MLFRKRVFGSYRKLGQTEIIFNVDHKIRLTRRKSISVFILPSNHFRKERKREKGLTDTAWERKRERKKDSLTRPNRRRSNEIAPSSSRRQSLSFLISLSLLNRNPPNTTTVEFEFRQRVPTLKIQPDKDVYRPDNPLIVTIQISNPDTTLSLLLDRIGFEIRAVEKLDSQRFATHKPLPGSSLICFLADLLDLFDLWFFFFLLWWCGWWRFGGFYVVWWWVLCGQW